MNMMLSRRSVLLQCSALVLATAEAQAGMVAFTQEAFDAAQAAGKPILVDIAASWCPMCKAQAPLIEGIAAKPEYASLVVFRVDFDAQKQVVKALNARKQGTLILFKGDEELDRSAGVTDPVAIEAMVKKAFPGA